MDCLFRHALRFDLATSPPKKIQASPARSLFLLAIHYLEATMFFAILYMFVEMWNGESLFARCNALTPGEAFYFSFATITTLGYGDMTPAKPVVRALIVPEVLLGLFMAIVAVGRILAVETPNK